jgi:hypothetical protein
LTVNRRALVAQILGRGATSAVAVGEAVDVQLGRAEVAHRASHSGRPRRAIWRRRDRADDARFAVRTAPHRDQHRVGHVQNLFSVRDGCRPRTGGPSDLARNSA